MNYSEAFLYGAVQGLTEYLPVSSTAHLILIPQFLHQEDPGLAFDIFLHIGTLAATLIYFWKEWWALFRAIPGMGPRPKARVEEWKLIIAGTVPVLFAGALLHKWVETVFRGNAVMVITLAVGGVVLYLVDRFFPQKKSMEKMSISDATWVGVVQCLALIPGMSRSGSTMTGARLLGVDRWSSAKFSFLISAPVTAAAAVFEARHFHDLAANTVGTGPLLMACFSSFLFGCLAIGGLLAFLRRFGFFSFAIYRIAAAIFIWKYLGP